MSHWDGLCSFLNDGRVELDSNIIERSIPAADPQPQERAFRRLRRWRKQLGGYRLAHRNRQIEQRRPTSLARSHSNAPCRGPSYQCPWRPYTIDLRCPRGGITALTTINDV